LPRLTCAAGTFSGTWIKEVIPGDSGRIEGDWFDSEGELAGTMAGTFWTTPNGNRRFEMSISHPVMTVVLAEAHGTWYYDDPSLCPTCGEGRGVLQGKIIWSDPEGQEGHLYGTFGEIGISFDVPELDLNGVWKIRCRDLFDTEVSNVQ
jgi:hypothetical protein